MINSTEQATNKEILLSYVQVAAFAILRIFPVNYSYKGFAMLSMIIKREPLITSSLQKRGNFEHRDKFESQIILMRTLTSDSGSLLNSWNLHPWMMSTLL